ncbi:hypothetical protein, partial [Janthinobacterium sp.]|uniref:hypothetical protein n=1 Tax=Janthinobacterium sp. TaxID=1871054 RepID=UPI00293D2AE7
MGRRQRKVPDAPSESDDYDIFSSEGEGDEEIPLKPAAKPMKPAIIPLKPAAAVTPAIAKTSAEHGDVHTNSALEGERDITDRTEVEADTGSAIGADSYRAQSLQDEFINSRGNEAVSSRSELMQLHHTFQRVLGFTMENISLILEEEGMTTLSDFRSFPLDMFPRLAEKAKLKTSTLKKLRVFCAWLDRQPDGGKTWSFSPVVLKRELARGTSDSVSRREDHKATAPMPDKFGGAPSKWANFKTQYEAYVNSMSMEYSSVLSHSRVRYKYDLPAGPQADAIANDTDPLFLHDNNRIGRNKAVFNMLKSLTSDGDAYTHVLQHEKEQDGRAAWILLCAFYEGTDMLSITAEESRLKMEEARFTGGKGSFQKYLTTHLQAHTLMETNPEFNTVYSDYHKKELLLRGIRGTEFLPVIAVARSYPDWSFIKLVNFLRTQVTTQELTAKREERTARNTKGNEQYDKGKKRRGKRKNEGEEAPTGTSKSQHVGTSRKNQNSLPIPVWNALSR